MTQKTVTVRALKAFPYAGRTVVVGEPVTMPPAEALARARQREVSLDRAYNAQALTPEPEPEPEIVTPRPKRRYRRRYMTADQT